MLTDGSSYMHIDCVTSINIMGQRGLSAFSVAKFWNGTDSALAEPKLLTEHEYQNRACDEPCLTPSSSFRYEYVLIIINYNY